MALPWPDSPYGFSSNVQLNQCNIDVAVACGMTGVRRILNWSTLEPTEGSFDATTLAQLDTEVQRAYTAQLNFTFVVEKAPTWANSGGSNPTFHNGCTNIDPTKALNFVQYLLNRYNGGTVPNAVIARIETGNEGYDDVGGGTCQSFENAVPVLQTVYPWVKANYPNVLVGTPAHFNLQTSNILNVHTSLYSSFYGSAKGYFDYVNYHWYGQVNDGTGYTGPNGVQPAGRDTFNQEWQDIHSIDAAYGNGSIPVYVTETGMAVPGANGINTEADKSAFFCGGEGTSGVFQSGQNSGGVLTHIYIWTIQNSNGYSITQGCSGWVPRPAFGAIQSFIAAYPQWSNTGEYSTFTAHH